MQSPEEIEKLTVDENLTEMERACLLISTGQDVQKVCVLEHLVDLMNKYNMDCLSKVIPKICVSEVHVNRDSLLSTKKFKGMLAW